MKSEQQIDGDGSASAAAHGALALAGSEGLGGASARPWQHAARSWPLLAAVLLACASCESDDVEPAPAVDGTEAAAECEFEYLGDLVRCENAGYPNTVETDATDLESCMQLCLERDDCTGVTDYFWLGLPDLGCFLYTSTCDAPSSPVWAEEDGGREYRRVCAAAP